MVALASVWLIHFRHLWNRWMEFAKTWQGARTQRHVPSFFGSIGKTRCPPGLWLAETFSTFSLEPLNGIYWNLTRRKKSMSSTKFVFHVVRKYNVFTPDADWLRHSLIFSETAERNLLKLDRKQEPNVLFRVYVFRADRKTKMATALVSDWPRRFRFMKPLNGFWQNLKGSKKPTPFTKFMFFGSIG